MCVSKLVTGKEYGVSKMVTEEKDSLKYGYGRKKGSQIGLRKQIGFQKWLRTKNFSKHF